MNVHLHSIVSKFEEDKQNVDISPTLEKFMRTSTLTKVARRP